MQHSVDLKYPISLQIEVTENCNHKCFIVIITGELTILLLKK